MHVRTERMEKLDRIWAKMEDSLQRLKGNLLAEYWLDQLFKINELLFQARNLIKASSKINGISVVLDRNQGVDKEGRTFGYVCGDEGGFFFTWMPTLEATLESVEIDTADGDGGLDRDGVMEFLREKLASKF